jgi:hypothetical protein
MDLVVLAQEALPVEKLEERSEEPEPQLREAALQCLAELLQVHLEEAMRLQDFCG